MTNKLFKGASNLVKSLFANEENYKVIIADKNGIVFKKDYNSIREGKLAAQNCIAELSDIQYGMIIHNPTGAIKHHFS